MAQTELSRPPAVVDSKPPTFITTNDTTHNSSPESGTSHGPASAPERDLFHEVMYDAGEFGKAFIHSAVENPINGIGQIVSLGHLPELHLVELDEHATGAAKVAQVAGNIVGTLVDCVILSEVAAVAVAGMIGEAAVAGTAAVETASTLGLGGRLAATGLAGFTSGAILTPLQPGESQWDRLTNGVTQAAAFMTFDGVSTAVGSQFANPTFLNSVFKGGVSGALAGTVDANVKSVVTGHGLATPEQTASEALSWGTGGAIMGGGSYLLSKGWEALTAKGETSADAATDGAAKDGAAKDGAAESAARPAKLADGRDVKVSFETGADGAARVNQVEMPDGTVLSRQADGKSWLASSANDAPGPARTEWLGDVKVNDQGQVRFVYRFEKAPSNVSLEARLPDGSKVALSAGDGSLTLPGGTINAVSERLPDAAAQSARSLNLDIASDRLRLDGVTTNGGVTSNFVVDLSAEEAAKVRALAAQNAAVKIVPAEQPIGVTSAANAPGHIGENLPGAYEYNTPMADHTASMAVFKKGDDGAWKVLTGLRDNEPFKGHEALPGGFLDLSGTAVETPAQAATREVLEETGVVVKDPTMVGVADELGRDGRNRIIDFGFGSVLPADNPGTLDPTSDLKGLEWKDLNSLLADPKRLAFDHYRLLTQAYEQLIKGKMP